MADPNGAPTPRDDAHDESAWTDAWAKERWSELVADLDPAADAQSAAPADPTELRPTDPGPAGPGSGTAPSTAPRSDDGWGAFDVAPWVRGSGPRDATTSDEVEALEEEQSHFQRPVPPPVLSRDPLKNLAWGVLALVPVALLVTLFTVRPFPHLVGEIGGLLFLAAVGVLVWRMPHRREDDDDPGAVV